MHLQLLMNEFHACIHVLEEEQKCISDGCVHKYFLHFLSIKRGGSAKVGFVVALKNG